MICRIEGGETFLQTYNAENRLSGVALVTGDCDTPGDISKVWQFTYDGDGSRVKQVYTEGTSTLTTYYYMGGSYEVQTDGTTETSKQYYGISGMTVAMQSAGSWTYFLTDHLGSVVATTDASGAVLSQTRYTEFGEVRTDVGSITQTDFGYTFQRNLPDTGLMDYKARMYDPYLNQWTQPDSIIPNQSVPQSWNRYSYVNRNPINYSDPTGHMLWQGDGGGEIGELTQNLALDSNLKCKAGDKKYCSYAQNHPVETAAFVVGGLTLSGVLGAAASGVTFSTTTIVTTGTTAGPTAESINLACGGDCSDKIRTGTNTVYRVIEQGKTIYIGITKNIEQRGAYWANTKNWQIQPIPGLTENLSRIDARAVEQYLLDMYGLSNLQNQINSITNSNPNIIEYLIRANDILNKVNYFK